LIALQTPSRILEYGPYKQLDYYRDGLRPGAIPFTGIVVYAKQGTLLTAIAYGCTWKHVFFEDKEEEATIQDQFKKCVEARFPQPQGGAPLDGAGPEKMVD
jgi:hypothetical protein